MMTKAEIEACIEIAVEDLFINGSGQRADRLILIAGTQDIGGLCREAIKDWLLKFVEHYTEGK